MFTVSSLRSFMFAFGSMLYVLQVHAADSKEPLSRRGFLKVGAGATATAATIPPITASTALLASPSNPTSSPTSIPASDFSLLFDPDGSLTRQRSKEIEELIPSTVSVSHGMSYAQDRFDLVLDWAKHNTESAKPWAADIAELRKLVEERSLTVLEIHAQNKGGDWARFSEVFEQKGLDKQEKRMVEIVEGIEEKISDEPWASQDWNKIVASKIAALEPEIAQQLNVSIGQVRRSMNFIISDEAAPLFLMEVMNGELRLDPLPLISDEFTKLVIGRISSFSPAFAVDLRLGNDSSLHLRWDSMSANTRGHLEEAFKYEAQGIPGPIHFWFYSASPRATRGEISLPSHEKVMKAYLDFLTKLQNLRAKVELLYPSGLKSAALELLDNRFASAKAELLSLPDLMDGVRKENSYRLPKSEAEKIGTTTSESNFLEFLSLLRQAATPILQKLLFDAESVEPKTAATLLPPLESSPQEAAGCARLLEKPSTRDVLTPATFSTSAPEKVPLPRSISDDE